jgi:hypothetical protein
MNYHYDSVAIYKSAGLKGELLTYTNGEQADLVYSSDYFDINITSYKNGRISGTFSAKYTPFPLTSTSYDLRGTVLVTEGIINEVPVSY